MRHLKVAALGLTSLVAASSFAVAQSDTPMVAADAATHVAELSSEGTGEGTAWFRYDPQNNTFAWTVEFTGVDAQAAGVLCGDSTEFDINLAQADGSMQSPLQGQVNNLGGELTQELNDGACRVVIEPASAGAEVQGTIEATALMGGGG